jgi:GAF domain-containing protein
MSKKNWNFLKPPLYPDSKKNTEARIVHQLSLFVTAAGLICLVLFWILQSGYTNSTLIFAYLLFMGLITQIVLRTGRVEQSSILLVTLGWAGVSYLLYSFGGISTPLATLYLIVILAAGLLINIPAASATTILSVLAALGLALAEQNGLIQPIEMPVATTWLVYSLGFITSLFLVSQTLHTLRLNLENDRQNQTKLVQHNYELQEQLSSLSRRVSERTQEVSQYLLYIQIFTELSQTINAFPEADRLAQEAMDILQKRFGLYYAGLFLVDSSGQWAVLRAGTGETGKVMLARHHQIEIGSGMVGWCIANARARIAADVGEDAVRLATDELPNTRSEAAIAMRTLGKVSGAITLQSTRPNSFSQEMVTVLQSYADMLASAIENIRLNEEKQAALVKEKKLSEIGERRAWVEIFGGRGPRGLLYDRISIAPVRVESTQEIEEARRTGKPVQAENQETPTVYIPVPIRDQMAGVLTFRKRRGDEDWSEKDISLLQKLAARMGEAMDNARLYESIQRQAARDQLIAELTGRMRETLDVDTVLRTAAEEIYLALELEQVAVELNEAESIPSG